MVEETRPLLSTDRGEGGGASPGETMPLSSRDPLPPIARRALSMRTEPGNVDATMSFMVETAPGQVSIPGGEFDADALAAFAPAQRLQERYVLVEELGRGGMGMVFLGCDERLDRPVAIKVILPRALGGSAGSSLDSSARDSFADEARIGANLMHPAIATVFDYGFHDGKPFAVFEFLPGETLRDVLARRGRISLDETRLIIGTLAQALDFAHGRRVVHRDLKPENIRATEQGLFKILDLGLAKNFHEHDDWRFSGTPAYAAPEQAEGRPCDGRTDQYALALIAYEMLTAARPFVSKSWREMLDLHAKAAPPAPRSHAPDLPEGVNKAILQALDKDPNRRFATCEQFAVALGCQLLSAPTVQTPEILREATLRKIKGRYRSFDVMGFRSQRPYVALAPEAMWIASQAEMIQVPIGAITRVYRKKWSRELRLELNVARGRKVQRLRFGSRKECAAWLDAINGLLDERAKFGCDGDTVSEPRMDPVVLLAQRPSMRFQLLGNLECRSDKVTATRAGLQIRGAMIGADAVADIHEEKLPGFLKTERRSSGVAIRAVDHDGRLELKSRWFARQAWRIGGWMLLAMLFLAVPQMVGSLWVLLLRLFELESWLGKAERILEWDYLLTNLMPLWPLMLALGYRYLQWPQLARPVSLAFYGLIAKYLGVAFAAAVTLAAADNGRAVFVGGAQMVGVAGSCFFMFIYYSLARRAWQSYRELRLILEGEQWREPPLRKWTGRLSLGISAAFLVAMFGLQATAQYRTIQNIEERGVIVTPSGVTVNVPDLGKMKALTKKKVAREAR